MFYRPRNCNNFTHFAIIYSEVYGIMHIMLTSIFIMKALKDYSSMRLIVTLSKRMFIFKLKQIQKSFILKRGLALQLCGFGYYDLQICVLISSLKFRW